MGFHTDDYCLNFVDCCQRILGCQLQRQKMLVQHHGRVIQVKALPIGIPYSQFESFSLTAPTVYGENNSQKVCRKKKSVLPAFDYMIYIEVKSKSNVSGIILQCEQF